MNEAENREFIRQTIKKIIDSNANLSYLISQCKEGEAAIIAECTTLCAFMPTDLTLDERIDNLLKQYERHLVFRICMRMLRDKAFGASELFNGKVSKAKLYIQDTELLMQFTEKPVISYDVSNDCINSAYTFYCTSKDRETYQTLENAKCQIFFSTQYETTEYLLLDQACEGVFDKTIQLQITPMMWSETQTTSMSSLFTRTFRLSSLNKSLMLKYFEEAKII